MTLGRSAAKVWATNCPGPRARANAQLYSTASSCSSLCPSPAKNPRNLTVEQRAAQKLRENFAMMTDDETDGLLDPETGLSLRGRLVRDIEWKDAKHPQAPGFGKFYYAG